MFKAKIIQSIVGIMNNRVKCLITMTPGIGGKMEIYVTWFLHCRWSGKIYGEDRWNCYTCMYIINSRTTTKRETAWCYYNYFIYICQMAVLIKLGELYTYI